MGEDIRGKCQPFQPGEFDRCIACGGQTETMFLVFNATDDDEGMQCEACASGNCPLPEMTDAEFQALIAEIPTTKSLPEADWE